jgi:hypothetical protein
VQAKKRFHLEKFELRGGPATVEAKVEPKSSAESRVEPHSEPRAEPRSGDADA